jgi:uncharacterized SAM-dependent methyltransferase
VGYRISMKYFKNTELAKLYNVSEKSIRNWIDATEAGKLDLELYRDNERSYIANVSKNTFLIGELVQKGKKYKNSRGYRVITPSPDFYRTYNSKEIFDIISNLDVSREMPLQYSYFNGGATIWDAYVKKLSTENTPNILTNTIELLNNSMGYIDSLLKGHDRINIIDIGPGNCFPVHKLLEYFKSTERLNRYIAIDVSRDMLDIAERNIKAWFDTTINFEGYARDINYERFNDLLAVDSFGVAEEKVRNIVLCLGSTISNFREPNQPLYTIHESMGRNDLLIFSKQLDTVNARRYFDFNTAPGSTSSLTPKSKLALDLLNIDESLYDAELFFDEEKMARYIQVRLKVALSIEFQLDNKSKVINFNKGESILLWRHNHLNTLQTLTQFDTSGFDLLKAAKSPDDECLLSISKIKLG